MWRALMSTSLVLLAFSLFTLNASRGVEASSGRNARGLVALSSLFGRVKSLQGELDGDLSTPHAGHDNARAAEADYEDAQAPPTFTSGKVAKSGPVIPGTRHWWRTNPVLLDQVLEEADGAYRLNIKLRNEHGLLRRFLENKGMPNQNQLFLDGLLIPVYQCPAEYRMGSWVDGGKWVCLSHHRQPKRPPFVLSIGSRGETSFEDAAFEQLGAVSRTVDFSLERHVAERVRDLPHIRLYEVGLTGTTDMASYSSKFPAVQWLNIVDLLNLVNARYVDIFKIDCESCEYGVVRDLAARYNRRTVPVGQIQMELHLPGENLPQTFETLKSLEDLGYRLFHAEINRFSDKTPLYHYEIALIHESLVTPLL